MSLKNLSILFVFFTLVSCKKHSSHLPLLKNMANKYAMITSCELYGETAFKGRLNTTNSPEFVYNTQGELICECDWSNGNTNTTCLDILKSKVIYCQKDNVWGHPEKDVYNLK